MNYNKADGRRKGFDDNKDWCKSNNWADKRLKEEGEEGKDNLAAAWKPKNRADLG